MDFCFFLEFYAKYLLAHNAYSLIYIHTCVLLVRMCKDVAVVVGVGVSVYWVGLM